MEVCFVSQREKMAEGCLAEGLGSWYELVGGGTWIGMQTGRQAGRQAGNGVSGR